MGPVLIGGCWCVSGEGEVMGSVLLVVGVSAVRGR